MNRSLLFTVLGLAAALLLVVSLADSLSSQEKGERTPRPRKTTMTRPPRSGRCPTTNGCWHFTWISSNRPKNWEKSTKPAKNGARPGPSMRKSSSSCRSIPPPRRSWPKCSSTSGGPNRSPSPSRPTRAGKTRASTCCANKPVSLTASGKWTFHLQVETNADGLTIPKELRDFNPGCLLGMIPDPSDPENNKPFVVGPAKQFIAGAERAAVPADVRHRPPRQRRRVEGRNPRHVQGLEVTLARAAALDFGTGTS